MRFGRLLLLAVVGGTAFLYLRPLFERHPEQDECTFGPVSNVQYRALLAEARRRSPAPWTWYNTWSEDYAPPNPVPLGDHAEPRHKIAYQITKRIDELSPDRSQIYHRIATMHAVMRAIGAYFSRAGLSSPGQKPYSVSMKRDGSMSFDSAIYQYFLDVHVVGGFFPVQRHTSISLNLSTRKGTYPTQFWKPQKQIGDFFTTIVMPEWKAGRVDRSVAENCPAIPDEDWTAEYLRKIAADKKTDQ